MFDSKSLELILVLYMVIMSVLACGPFPVVLPSPVPCLLSSIDPPIRRFALSYSGPCAYSRGSGPLSVYRFERASLIVIVDLLFALQSPPRALRMPNNRPNDSKQAEKDPIFLGTIPFNQEVKKLVDVGS